MGDQIVGPDFAVDVINRSCMDVWYGISFRVAIKLLSCVYSMGLRLDTNKFFSLTN